MYMHHRMLAGIDSHHMTNTYNVHHIVIVRVCSFNPPVVMSVPLSKIWE